MRKVLFWLLGTASVVVAVFAYRTSTQAVVPRDDAADSPGVAPSSAPTPDAQKQNADAGKSSQTPSPAATDSPTTAQSDAAPAAGAADGTYTGDAEDTRYGPVQVQVTVSGGRVTDVQVPVYPTRQREDQEINAYAVPILVQEAISAQNAQIDYVSGATFTSDGYVRSLQSALDQAGLR